MERKDFGKWGRHLDEQTFWQALAMLGVIDGQSATTSLTVTEAERIAGFGVFPHLLQPTDEEPGPVWQVSDELMESARRGELVEARWLVEQWQAHRGRGFLRMQSPELYSNQQEIAAAFREHARAALYFPLPPLTSARDWQWPLRVALARPDWQAALRDRMARREALRQLVSLSPADDARLVEFLALPGTPAEALEELETFRTPIRAHCLILLHEGEIVVDAEQVEAVFRLRQLTLAGGVILSSLRDADPERWMVDLFEGLADNVAIDQTLAKALTPPPLTFFDPELFGLAKLKTFGKKVSTLQGGNVTRSAHLEDLLEAANRLKSARPAFSTYSYSVGEAPPERRLQINVLEGDRLAQRFHAAHRYHVDAWIGQRKGALSGAGLPEQLLPDADGYLLVVTLFAPAHMDQPIIQTIYLPQEGESTPCRFSFETSGDIPRFEARITIAYLNRVLQTYLLTGAPDEAIALTPEMATAADWQGLRLQQPYGATIVLNRMQGGHHAMMQVGYKVLAFSIEGLNEAMTQIESKLDASKWDSPDFKGLKAKGSGKLILYLAKHGSELLKVMKLHAPAGKAGQTFLENLLQADPVQVLAANLGARLPVELFYGNPYPKDSAERCPVYDEEPDRKSCKGCPHADQDHYCPLGFWSLHKVIEWHDFEAAKIRQQEFAPREFAVEADDELRRDRLGRVRQALVGVSSKAGLVEQEIVTDLIERIRAAGIDPIVVTDWDDWTAKIKENVPRLLVLVPHTSKNDFDEECIEICDQAIASGLIDDTYIARGRHPGPIVLLIGCNTENLGIPFRNFAVKFMTGGSAIVVSTITHVLGRHAAPLAAELVEAIAKAQGDVTFGSLMLDVRRRWLKSDQPPISLGLKCFGDARWRF
jgi:hypothetical protein